MSNDDLMMWEQGETGRAVLAGVSCAADGAGHCVTCSDEALPALVVRVDEAAALAVVAIDEVLGEVDISLVDAVQAGRWLLVHGGVAIAELEGQ